MRVLAYARRGSTGLSVAEQITKSERFASEQGHDVRRLVGVDLLPTVTEHPPMPRLMDACTRELVGAVVVHDLSVLGPDLLKTLQRLEAAGACVLVAGDGETALHLRSPELQLAVKVAQAIRSNERAKVSTPKRVCAPRVFVDVAEVRALQQRGARLDQVAYELGVSRSTVVRRLKCDRERRAATK